MLKVYQIIEGKDGLVKLIAQPLPLSISWDLKLFFKKLSAELETYEELRGELAKQYGTPMEGKPGMVSFSPENAELYSSGVKELQEKEIDIEVKTIKIQTLLDYKDKEGRGIEMSIDDLLKLDWLVVE